MFTRSRLVVGVIALVVLIGGIWAITSFFNDDNGAVAMIQADNTAYKVKPTDAGGMEIPHQDKMVFGANGKSNVEHLTPPSEQPIDAMAASEEVASADNAPSVEAPSLSTEPAPPATAPASAVKTDSPSAMGRVVQPSGRAEPTLAANAKPVEAAPAFNMTGKTDAPAAATKKIESVIPASPAAQPQPVPPATAASAPAEAPAASETAEPAAPQPANMAMEPAVKAPKLSGAQRFQLASFNDSVSANRAASQLAKKYNAALNGASLSVVQGTAKGRQVYRVQGGSDEASNVCQSVKSAGGSCVIVR